MILTTSDNKQIEIPDAMMEKIYIAVRNKWLFYDGIDDFFVSALRKELLFVRR